MAATDRLTFVSSTQTPGFSSGLVVVQGPICGRPSGGQWWKSPITDLLGAVAASRGTARIARRRAHLATWTTPTSISFVTNGDGFIRASRQGSVATC